MARFRFKIVDGQGRRRSGILRADSLEVAQATLHSKLCQIDELTPLADEGQALAIGDLSRSFSRSDAVRRVLAVLLTCLGLAFLIGWAQAPKKTEPSLDAGQLVEFAVKGHLDFSSLGLRHTFDEPVVYAVFPELAYEVESQLSDEGSFSLPFSLIAPRPKTVFLEVALAGKRWSVTSELSLPASGDFDLGVVRVQKPKVDPDLELATLAVPSLTSHGRTSSVQPKPEKKKRRPSIRKLLEERRKPK